MIVGVIPGLFKADIDAAFRRIPVKPAHRWACGVAFRVRDTVCFVCWLVPCNLVSLFGFRYSARSILPVPSARWPPCTDGKGWVRPWHTLPEFISSCRSCDTLMTFSGQGGAVITFFRFPCCRAVRLLFRVVVSPCRLRALPCDCGVLFEVGHAGAWNAMLCESRRLYPRSWVDRRGKTRVRRFTDCPWRLNFIVRCGFCHAPSPGQGRQMVMGTPFCP